MSFDVKPIARLLFLGNPVTDRRVKNFLALFLDLSYQVELIFATPGQTNIGLQIEGVQIKQLAMKYSGGLRMFRQYDKLLTAQLRNLPSCDIVFACELYSLQPAVEIKRQGRAKQLLYDARELYTELPTVSGNKLKKWFWKKHERIGLKQTDLVIVTAPDDAEAIKGVHHFLPPSILIRNFPMQEEYSPNAYLREYFYIPQGKKIFVYVGGLQKDRGLEKMAALMNNFRDEAVFVLIGEGSLKDHLLELRRSLRLEEIVFFHPPIDSESVIKILSSADAGISLIEQRSKSYELALPSKVFEYMHAGLPVLSSPLKQVKDLLSESEGIIFANPDDTNELLAACRKILELAADRNLRKDIYEKASKNYSFESDAKSLKEYLSQT